MPERTKPFLRELAVEQDIDLEQLQQEDAIWPWLADAFGLVLLFVLLWLLFSMPWIL